MKEKYYVVAKTITKWKLDNPFENWLGYKADTSEFWKIIYVFYYKIFDHKYYKKGLEYINKEIQKQRPNLLCNFAQNSLTDKMLRRDIIYSLHRFGVNFVEYFVYEFYNKNHIGRSALNNLRIQYGYCELVNDPSIRDIFEDKVKTFLNFKSYYKRDAIAVQTVDDKADFEAFLHKHKTFIYKPLRGVCGKGVKIYKDFDLNIELFLNQSLKDGPFIIEELIEQAPEMAALHKESINTVRITTFTIGKNVTIFGAALRMGIGNSVVDNAGSGGIYCHINYEQGFVDTNAKDYLGNEYSYHPDTNVRMIGFNIPQWQDLLDVAKSVALVIQGATVISWDFAYSKKGWVLLEGNDVGEPLLIQDYNKGNKYILHSLIDKYFEYKTNNKLN